MFEWSSHQAAVIHILFDVFTAAERLLSTLMWANMSFDNGFDRDGSLQTQIVIIVIIFEFWYMMIWCTFFGIDHNEKSISISERNPYDFRWIFDLIVGNLQFGIKDSMHFFARQNFVVNFFLAAKTKAQKPLKNAARKYAQSKIPEIFFCCRKMVCAKSPLGPSNNNKNDLWKRIIIYDDFFFSFLAVLSFFFDDRHFFFIHLSPSSHAASF